jgi:hypothetical protein
MRSIVTISLLFVTSLVQTGFGQPATATRRQKPLSLDWVESVPFVGCDKGTPVPNVDIPDTNAPMPMCEGVQPPDMLPPAPRSLPKAAQNAVPEVEVGTVIVMGLSRDKIVLAADSRNTLVTSLTRPDGTVGQKLDYDDTACKLTQLTPKILFAAAGLVVAKNTIPSTVLYDAHKLARMAARNYRSASQENQLPGDALAAIATRWAWDVDFRLHHGFANGWKPIWTSEGLFLEGIFAGLEPNGELGFAVAKLVYPKKQTGLRVPPVTFSVGTFKTLPTTFTWVEAFGMKDVAETYYSARVMTEETKPENKLISIEMLKDPKLFSPKIPERLVDLTIQHYKAMAVAGGLPLLVHEPIDVAVLERGKQINWVHSKGCSGAQTQTSPTKRVEKTHRSKPPTVR